MNQPLNKEDEPQNSTSKSLSRSVKAIALTLGQSAGAVAALAVTMVMTRVLIKGDLAAYRQTLLAYAVVQPILGLGVQQAIFYYLPVEKERIRGRVADAIALVSIMGMLYGIFIALGGNQILASRFSNPRVAEMLLWMIPYSLFTLPSSLTPSVLVARDRVVQSSIFTVSRQLFIGFGTVLPLLIWQNAESPLIGNVVASVLFGVEAIFLMLRSTPTGSARPSLSGMREMLAFSIPLGLASMIGTITVQVDKLIVGVMCSPEEFAVFAVGAMEVPFLALVTGSITMVVIADMRKAIDAKKFAEALRLFHAVAIKSSLVIYPLGVFLFVCADPFIRVLFSDAYAGSVDPFRLYLLKLPYRVVVFGALLVALGRNKLILRMSAISLIVSSILSVLFVQIIGPVGAVIGPICSAYLVVFPEYIRKISGDFDVPWTKSLPFAMLVRTFILSLPVGALSFVGLLLTNEHPYILRLAVATALVTPYCLWWWNGKLYNWNRVSQRFLNIVRS